MRMRIDARPAVLSLLLALFVSKLALAHNIRPERELLIQVDGRGVAAMWRMSVVGWRADVLLAVHDLNRDGVLDEGPGGPGCSPHGQIEGLLHLPVRRSGFLGGRQASGYSGAAASGREGRQGHQLARLLVHRLFEVELRELLQRHRSLLRAMWPRVFTARVA